MFQTKEYNKIPEELSEVKIGNLPKREFRVVVCFFLNTIRSKNSGKEWTYGERSWKFLTKS